MAAAALLNDDETQLTAPTPRFVRPLVSYMEFLKLQHSLLSDNGDRIVFDTFRMGLAELDQLVDVCKDFLNPKLCAKRVICVCLQWLATGASVRAQEQLFLDRGFSTIHYYRIHGLQAILRGLVSCGFYDGDINNAARLEKSSLAFSSDEPSLRGCVGAMDGTHIPIVVPREYADKYRNRYVYSNSNAYLY
ncbi:hypothetical protein AaE_015776 [Aphanomyces astaci]|uniref:DDE Tnp4 domain-containing protein n=1 Tax=Aphanomyces astaci TaxID=112090 RepID=A0A6A4Z1G5_APHAT|nr:hypothetical protein AaE_015776 [Aphanomyces astaci]